MVISEHSDSGVSISSLKSLSRGSSCVIINDQLVLWACAHLDNNTTAFDYFTRLSFLVYLAQAYPFSKFSIILYLDQVKFI